MIEFEVIGEPKPGGSKRGFVNPKTGGVIITDDSGKAGKTWRADVKDAALDAMAGRAPLLEAIWLGVTFFRDRPKGHYGSGRNAGVVKLSAPRYPATRPDSTKLLRALEDAMTGIVWKDDSQVIRLVVEKHWADAMNRQGARVQVRLMDEVEGLGIAALSSGSYPESEGAQLPL